MRDVRRIFGAGAELGTMAAALVTLVRTSLDRVVNINRLPLAEILA
jgi:hypothetical protein